MLGTDNSIRVLLIHKTVWLNDKPYPTAKGNVRKLLCKPEYAQFDVVISGDNHKAFTYRKGRTLWVNCGCLYRTSCAEKEYVPGFWEFSYSTKKNRVLAKHVPVTFRVKDVSTKHLELEKKQREFVQKAEREWDSVFAQSLENNGNKERVRPCSFMENIKKALLKESKDVKSKTWFCLGV